MLSSVYIQYLKIYNLSVILKKRQFFAPISFFGTYTHLPYYSHMLRLFSTGMKPPSKSSKVVYIDGAWDMFHCGHLAILKKIKKRGDYLLVGVHGDATVNRNRGGNLPLMNLQERVLSIIGCRYVDDVLIDAPWDITSEMVAFLNITEVVHGTISDAIRGEQHDVCDERYRYPKEAGLFSIVESPTDFNLKNIVDRIQGNQKKFLEKITKKKKEERDYYGLKYNSRLL